MSEKYPVAPELCVSQWLNSADDIGLRGLRGNVAVIMAFQMLCPGCVAQAIPQIKAVHSLFSGMNVSVLGLHTVFEHHEAMTPQALKAFLHEYRISFPVGIDRPGARGNPVPQTMSLYGMEGTPTLLLIDRHGRLRRQHFGHMHDMQLGAEIMALVNESIQDEDTNSVSADG